MEKYILKIGLLTVFILGHCQTILAQILEPVHWSYAAKKIDKHEAVLLIKATIEDGWHIYSTTQNDAGPLKTSITIKVSNAYRTIDNIVEPIPITKYENAFKMDVHYFEKAVIFQQKIALTSSDAVVRGKVSFMTCNDQKCLPPDEVSFSILVK